MKNIKKIEYKRISYDETKEKLEKMIEELKTIKDFEKFLKIVREIIELQNEIEEMYENEYEEVNVDSVEEMKKLYTKDEMKEAVLLDKAQQYVFDNAKISYNNKIK